MFKATEVERTIEINLIIDMQINIFLCRTSDHSELTKFLEDKQIMAAKKMR